MSISASEYSDLVITITSSYDAVLFDRGTGATRYAGFWNPKSQGLLRPLGSVGVESYDDINGNRRPYPDLGRAKEPVSFWRPVPPKGYISLGDIAHKGWNEPDVYRIWCLRDDLAVRGSHAPRRFWDTSKSKAKEMSVWEVQPILHSSRVTGQDSSSKIAFALGNFCNVEGYSPPDASLANVVVLPVESLINTK
ncbi:vacuolar protein sorting-associated protein [Hirsutella rhossiliensis]|uniref:Vacuolar protein sorting-associated protein 62 domain-containing protein n=1 Tax=Hirsutella rhossiliensis TaxID=111463 RepID=A0A9P8N3U7_9HYPO|nr:vacuolar protein sorting-associated protein 62 domain-containing protein [Hirsutella rhossiliensis]KAH0967868.1 vacuolar protein sorting-associated protein 62 domain-containing protein [Hirsutella rhossiliensis]